MVARLWRWTTPVSCVISIQSRLKRPGYRHLMLALFSNLSCLIPTQPLLHMVQHVADRVSPFLRSRHTSPPPLKFLHIPLSPPLFFPPLRARELGAIIIITGGDMNYSWNLFISWLVIFHLLYLSSIQNNKTSITGLMCTFNSCPSLLLGFFLLEWIGSSIKMNLFIYLSLNDEFMMHRNDYAVSNLNSGYFPSYLLIWPVIVIFAGYLLIDIPSYDN